MVDFSDELGPKNEFFTLLQTKYSLAMARAQQQSNLICIPHSSTLANTRFNIEFVNYHLLQPSPYIKSQFIAKLAREHEEVFSIGNGEILNDNIPSPVQIIYEEIGYDVNYVEYRTVVIDRPLHPKCDFSPLKSAGRTNIFEIIKQGETEWESLPTHRRARLFLNEQIGDFNDHYTILVDFLDHAISKIKEMCDQTMKKSFPNERRDLERKDILPIWIYVENYALMKAYDKIFYVCSKQCRKKDQEIFKHMSKNEELAIADFEIPPEFNFPFLSAIERISDLSSNHTPFAKLKCISDTLDLIANESQTLEKEEKILYNPSEPPLITADTLIPLFAYILLRAQAGLLCANLFYLNSFSLHTLHIPKLSYAMVTFQASLQFIYSRIGIDTDDTSPTRSTDEVGIDGSRYISQNRRSSLVHIGESPRHPLASDWSRSSREESLELVEERFINPMQSFNGESSTLNGTVTERSGLSRLVGKRHSIGGEGVTTPNLFSPAPPKEKSAFSKLSIATNETSSLGLDNVLAMLTAKDGGTHI